MKRTLTLLACLLLVTISQAKFSPAAGNSIAPDDSLFVWTTPGLYNMVTMWAEKFSSLNNDVNIEVKIAGETELATLGDDIGFVERFPATSNENDLQWRLVVARDVIVPVINTNNPYLEIVSRQGVSPGQIGQAISEHGKRVWGTLLNSDSDKPIHLYRTDDKSVNSHIADFIGMDNFASDGIKTLDCKSMLSSIINDPFAVGFCRLTDIVNSEGFAINDGIRVLPIDVNGNGSLDYYENIYDDLGTVTRGVWIGKYPKSLFTNIFLVASDKPHNEKQVAFLKWIVTDGQQYLGEKGYSELVLSERQSKLNQLVDNDFYITSSEGGINVVKIVLLVILVVIGGSILIRILTGNGSGILRRDKTPGKRTVVVMNEDSIDAPGGLYYDKSHTWAFMEQNGEVKIGIDDFLQRVTGQITKVILKNRGEKIKRGDILMRIVQEGKQLKIYSPVSGVVKERNDNLIYEAMIINRAPFSDGWVYNVEPGNWAGDIRHMKMSGDYKNWLKDEFGRLKDFLADIFHSVEAGPGLPVYQDGGEISESVLEEMNPKIWEDFQTKFLDTAR